PWWSVSWRACWTITPIPPDRARSLTTKATRNPLGRRQRGRLLLLAAARQRRPEAALEVVDVAAEVVALGDDLAQLGALLIDLRLEARVGRAEEGQVALALALPAAALVEVGLGQRAARADPARRRAEGDEEVRRHAVGAGAGARVEIDRPAVDRDRRRAVQRDLMGDDVALGQQRAQLGERALAPPGVVVGVLERPECVVGDAGQHGEALGQLDQRLDQRHERLEVLDGLE